MKKVLITGSAGFIGFHLCRRFLNENYIVHGVDNLNNYYSTKLKNKRNSELKKYSNFKFYKLDLKNKKIIDFFSKKKIRFYLSSFCTTRCKIFNNRSTKIY